MTIQIPDPGTGVPADKTGDNPWLAMTKVAANFSNQTHAASRSVGKTDGTIPEYTSEGISSTGIGGYAPTYSQSSNTGLLTALKASRSGLIRNTQTNALTHQYGIGMFNLAIDTYSGYTVGHAGDGIRFFGGLTAETTESAIYNVYTDKNVTKDSNGFLKGASPVVDLYNDCITLNDDAKQQGGITFEKLGVGDYLVKGSLGFAQQGWYIETPKDANGNVLVAVVYEQLANNDISIKTYAKRFDDETGDIVPNLTRPRDIPTERFISLRLHELPKEPPVMPTETQPEV